MSIKAIPLYANTNFNENSQPSRARSAKRKLFDNESTIPENPTKKISHGAQENISDNQKNIISNAFNNYIAAGNEQIEKDPNQIYENRIISYGVDIHTDKNIIGKGSFGSVREASSTAQSVWKIVAKTLSPHKSVDPKGLSSFAETELKNLQVLSEENAPHIVKQIDAFWIPEKRYASIQENAGQSLHEIYLNSKNLNKREITWPDLQRIGRQILIALHHLHTPNKERKNAIAHYDLKPANIAQDAEGIARILDFGLSQELIKDAKCPGGTPVYRAPETLFSYHQNLDNTLKTKADIWSLGCTLFELFTGERLVIVPGTKIVNMKLELLHVIRSRLNMSEFPSGSVEENLLTPEGFLKTAQSPSLSPFSNVIRSKVRNSKGEEFIDLLHDMLHFIPDYRKSALELINHPFFKTEAPNLNANNNANLEAIASNSGSFATDSHSKD